MVSQRNGHSLAQLVCRIHPKTPTAVVLVVKKFGEEVNMITG
jgi:hypothetical protein